jgi:agmatine deiminase
VIVAELDLGARQDWLALFPILATRRPALYRALILPGSESTARRPPGPATLLNPTRDGYFMPAEWQPHEQTWMGWPERGDNWRGSARFAQAAFVNVAKAIAEFEPVTVCASHKQYVTARELLPPSVRVVEMSSNDAWMRDIGPTFLVPRRQDSGDHFEPRGVHWIFNAWGGKMGGLYDCWDDDALVAQVCLAHARDMRFRAS